MFREALNKVISGADLSEIEMINCMNSIMNDEVSDVLKGGFLSALKTKGETSIEIAAGAKVLRSKSEVVDLDKFLTLDTCGTGGDKSGTYNISTASAIVVSSLEGISVVKHGNRSVSSRCGSADVLEALGVNINLTPKQVEKCVKDINIGFFFAPKFHRAMKYVANTRKELGIKTIFNILGPLTNPAKAKVQVLGVYSEELTETMAKVLNDIGVTRALVVHGMDGLDEISISTDTKICELKDGIINNYTINPKDFGLKNSSIAEIVGGYSDTNAQLIKDIFSGKEKGAKRDVLLLNTGAAFYIAGKANSIKEGIDITRYLIDSGAANNKLNQFIKYTNNF